MSRSTMRGPTAPGNHFTPRNDAQASTARPGSSRNQNLDACTVQAPATSHERGRISMEKSIVLQVDGLALQRDATDGVFRIRDIELAERLGYDRPRNIRRLIVAMIERGDLPGLMPRPTVKRIEKTRGFVQGTEARPFVVAQLGIVESIARGSVDKNDFWGRMEREYAGGYLQLALGAS